MYTALFASQTRDIFVPPICDVTRIRPAGSTPIFRHFFESHSPPPPPPPTIRRQIGVDSPLSIFFAEEKRKRKEERIPIRRETTPPYHSPYLSIRVFSPSSKIRHRGKTRQGPLTLPGSRLGRVYLRLLDTVAPIGDRKTWNRGGGVGSTWLH